MTASLDHGTGVARSDVPNPETELLARAARGDERALGTLFDRYAPALHALALRITGEASDADEVVLEVFTQAWRNTPPYDPGRGSVGAWLTMRARSRALDRIRAVNRRARLPERAAQAEPARVPGMGDSMAGVPGMDAEDTERRQVVQDALGLLSADQREAIELAFYGGLSQSEIARRLGQPLGTIKTRVRVGMGKLRDALRPYYSQAGL